MKKLVRIMLCSLVLLNIGVSTAMAANGQGVGQGRTDAVNVNDYSTDNWMRFEYNYQFDSGPDTKDTFGVPTQTDIVAKNPQLENVRRNKDASYLPPSYGVFSGDIPTSPSSLYHENDKPTYATNTTNTSAALDSYNGTLSSSMGNMSDSGVLPSTSTTQTPNTATNSNSGSEILISYSNDNNFLTTQASLYADGSLGTISIPKLKLDVKVFEGETLDNMKKGAGHFEFTSSWDGNVGIAGHNRGSAGYFEGVKNMQIGDEITFATKYGTRTYVVFSKEKISDTDYSKLGWSNENMITLITCVENVANQRWCVQAKAK